MKKLAEQMQFSDLLQTFGFRNFEMKILPSICFILYGIIAKTKQKENSNEINGDTSNIEQYSTKFGQKTDILKNQSIF